MASLTRVNAVTQVKSVLQHLLESAVDAPLPEWDRVARELSIRTVEPGGTVFLQDVAHPFVYAVRNGLLKLSYLKEDGAEWIKSFAYEGRFFASIAALEPGGRTSFMVTALETTVLERVDYHLLSSLGDKHLAWSQALRNMTMVFAARKEQRERELLTLNAERRYLAFREAYPELEARIPQKDLARHLGMTPVGINRIVARVRRNEAT